MLGHASTEVRQTVGRFYAIQDEFFEHGAFHIHADQARILLPASGRVDRVHMAVECHLLKALIGVEEVP